MKVLAIDDQKLVLIPLSLRLEELGYLVLTETSAKKGIEVYNSFKPDLVIVDLMMPQVSGMEVVKYIRNVKKESTPIMVLSGNTDANTIVRGFDLGINDYMKKPLSLVEVCARVKLLIGAPVKRNQQIINKGIIIQKRCVGVVIPCYNEAKRLLSKEFISFITKNSGYRLCFVNDGSLDNTAQILINLRKGREDYITVYTCKKNVGKAEAVRKGMLHMAKQLDLDYFGFLDADLSTGLNDFDHLVSVIENSKYKVVSGSRIRRMGANIKKESSRRFISWSINFIIRKILSLDFKDTQCGAKIFHKDVLEVSFKDKFITKWIFDVEVFRRITLYYGLNKAKKIFYEQPLKRWVHAEGSKLSTKDSIKIIGQLIQVAWYYRKRKVKRAERSSFEKRGENYFVLPRLKNAKV
jgi:CheY-like chemotaxis protein